MRTLDSAVQELARLGATEVWLIGSRANGTARDDSDWDLLVVGKTKLRRRLAAYDPWTGFDVLVRARWKNGVVFVSPWKNEGRKRKAITAKSLRWRATSESSAEYWEMKASRHRLDIAIAHQRVAQRLLPRHSQE